MSQCCRLIYMKPRVLLVRNASSHDFGGGERYPIYIADVLSLHKFHPIVTSSHSKILDLAEEHDIEHHRMPWLRLQNFSGFRTALFPVFLLWQLYLLIWYTLFCVHHKIDILHLQSRDDFIAGTFVGKMLKKKVIWTDHADLKYIYQNTDVMYKNPIGKLVRYCARKADAIIIVSQNELSLIRRTVNKLSGNYVVIYNGVINSDIASVRNYDKNTFVISATSRLVFSKGLAELIAATKMLNENGVTAVTVLLGEGPDKLALQKLADKNIVFMGFPPDALSIVAGSDVFVHPSYNEGFSLSLVEAAMLAKPVIATNVGGNPEIIVNKQTGMLVQPKSTDQLHEALLFAYHHPKEMQKYATALHKDYLARFQFDEIVKNNVIPLYN